jgi:NAD(P)-dependent dehydrogenase (short-subunit alcohol dehydrogenase family)
MGSLSIRSDADSPMAKFPTVLAYSASKTALNALTVFFAKELQGTLIKINSVSPGYVATDMSRHIGDLTAEQGARVPATYATLPADGPTGGFFEAQGQIAW